MKQLYTVNLFLFFALQAMAQPQPNGYEPDLSRALFHYNLDNAQKNMLALDGHADNLLSVSADEEVNLQLTYQVTTRVDQMQKDLETSATLSASDKITYLRGLTDLLTTMGQEIRKRNLTWDALPIVVQGYEEAMNLSIARKPILPAFEPLPYKSSQLLAHNFAFRESSDIQEIREHLLLKYLAEHPREIMQQLSQHPEYSIADSLIRVVARQRPEELITYAQARNTGIGRKVIACQDPLVKMIVELASDNRGQLYLPFLDQLSTNAVSRDEISRAVRDSTAYYSLLVNTEISYARRMLQGDTPVSRRALQDMLRRKSLETYVNTINGLHDEAADIRFRCIRQLTTPELYYLIVMNETEIYTSSYMYVYNQLFERMSVKSADSLLNLVAYDKYKKFLTMASNYNTLDNFLGRMSQENATSLMTSFVSNLDRGTNSDDIEDAVDVANAYASIRNLALKKMMLQEVMKNLQVATVTQNKKGMVVYRLEKVIMESNIAEYDSNQVAVNISDSLGIPPVYEIRNPQLRDSLGRIVMQMYFYGDASGKGTFNHLLRFYGDRSKWAMKSTPEWVQFTSIGTPVPFVLFANRALDEEKDEDEDAQRKLIEWMGKNGYAPSISVHRGHSYYLKYTIEKMLPSSKVVVLGSCGAYHNLSDILEISPEAYIISSKQVGYGEINVALFSYLVDRLKMGLDVKWPAMMTEVATRISAEKREGYDDYIFPHQNLGALFIKAYKIATGAEGEGISRIIP